MKRVLIWAPFVGFLLFVVIVALRFAKPDDHVVRSAMVGKPLPAFALAPIVPDKPGVRSAGFAGGKPRLVNIFASWCIPCAAEAPQLMQLKAAGVEIDAIAVRDTGPEIATFLQRYGDPYARIGDDKTGATQISMGSSGVPESFVVDGQGRIALQHVGEIRADDLPEILKAVEAAK
jgi:cytochrome c biogenesis protein CcmG, thiol:disulfide interchange protein DsbE